MILSKSLQIIKKYIVSPATVNQAFICTEIISAAQLTSPADKKHDQKNRPQIFFFLL